MTRRLKRNAMRRKDTLNPGGLFRRYECHHCHMRFFLGISWWWHYAAYPRECRPGYLPWSDPDHDIVGDLHNAAQEGRAEWSRDKVHDKLMAAEHRAMAFAWSHYLRGHHYGVSGPYGDRAVECNCGEVFPAVGEDVRDEAHLGNYR